MPWPPHELTPSEFWCWTPQNQRPCEGTLVMGVNSAEEAAREHGREVYDRFKGDAPQFRVQVRDHRDRTTLWKVMGEVVPTVKITVGEIK